MEEAFIKVRLLLKDKRELDNAVKSINQKLGEGSKVIASNFGKELKKDNSIGKNLANNFGKALLGGAFGIGAIAVALSDYFLKSFERSLNEEQRLREKASQITMLQRMTGGNIGDVLTTQYLLNRSGTRNSFGFFNNFTEKLNETRNGESNFLKDYENLNNSEAFNKFFEDLQQADIETRNKAVHTIWPSIYADNANMILASNVSQIKKNTEERIKNIGDENKIQEALKSSFDFGFEEENKQAEADLKNLLLLNQDDRYNTISKNSERERTKTRLDIENMDITSPSKGIRDYLNILSKEVIFGVTKSVKKGFENYTQASTFQRYVEKNKDRIINGANK